ncbi:MAG: DedA family protein [Thermoplasmata archaeon]|nr:DedA family protein [Thermoplasmata archaeon]
MVFSLVGEVVNLIVWILQTIGLPGLFVLMMVESFGIPPIPSEVILTFSGFLVAEGIFPLPGAIAVALVGGLVGSYVAYALGRWGREKITGIGLGALRIEPSHLERMDRWFSRHGEVTVALARLVPVVRSYISYPAGTARMEPVRFGIYTTVGSTPFVLVLLYAGIVLRSRWATITSYFTLLDYAFGALAGLAVVYLVLLVMGWVEPGWPPRVRDRATGSPPTDAVARPPP